MSKHKRSKKDHITQQAFVAFKCSRCRKLYTRMEIDNEVKTCPPCMNGKVEDE